MTVHARERGLSRAHKGAQTHWQVLAESIGDGQMSKGDHPGNLRRPVNKVAQRESPKPWFWLFVGFAFVAVLILLIPCVRIARIAHAVSYVHSLNGVVDFGSEDPENGIGFFWILHSEVTGVYIGPMKAAKLHNQFLHYSSEEYLDDGFDNGSLLDCHDVDVRELLVFNKLQILYLERQNVTNFNLILQFDDLKTVSIVGANVDQHELDIVRKSNPSLKVVTDR